MRNGLLIPLFLYDLQSDTTLYLRNAWDPDAPVMEVSVPVELTADYNRAPTPAQYDARMRQLGAILRGAVGVDDSNTLIATVAALRDPAMEELRVIADAPGTGPPAEYVNWIGWHERLFHDKRYRLFPCGEVNTSWHAHSLIMP